MKTKHLSLLAITALLFASCGSGGDTPVDPIDPIDPDLVAVKFSSSIVTTTRVVDQSWVANDAIGIYMFNTGTTTIAEGADNKKYLAKASGATTTLLPDANQTIYYPEDGAKKVDFLAYYPYLTPITNYQYPVNVAVQTTQSAIDFMLADKVAGKDKNSTTIALVFQHKLSKLILNVKKGEGVTSLDGLKVKIKGMNTKAAFDITKGMLGASSGVTDIVPANGAVADAFQAILLPVAAFTSNHIMEFTLGVETYPWAMTDGTATSLIAGSEYTYTVTLAKPGVTEVTATIKPWNPIDGGTGSAQ